MRGACRALGRLVPAAGVRGAGAARVQACVPPCRAPVLDTHPPTTATPPSPPKQEGRVVVELGEAASAARFNLFGPALYSLDAQDSFGDDVKVRGGGGRL